MKTKLFAGLALLSLAFPLAAHADDRNPAEEEQRWQLVRDSVYHGQSMQDAGDAVTLTAPYRAMDAALVPLTVKFDTPKHVTGLTLFVDNNPAPLVGRFKFGAAISPSQIKLRVRINAYTLVHAVAETEDGALLVTSQYVKAAGGCSAPSTGQSAEIQAKIGQMQLNRSRPAEGMSVPTQLLISHPNFNGMQMGLGGTNFIPPRYLETITVKTGGVTIFDFQSDISLSEDPVISFSYTPSGDGKVEVVAHDSSGAEFKRQFEALAN
jgi:sulfur-oxidizing protein SoxY